MLLVSSAKGPEKVENRTFRHFGAEAFDMKKFVPVTNTSGFRCKPTGGLWASPVDHPEGWDAWCRAEEFHLSSLSKYFDFRLWEGTRVARVDSLLDLEHWIRLYPHPAPLAGMGFGDEHPTIDFESLKRDFDVIELTGRGQGTTRLTKPNLYGWDCACILVLRKSVVIPL